MSRDKKIPLVEKFGPTIQGEGATIGLQTYFLRFGLCDYRCTMCDSMHAVDPLQVKANAQWLTQDEIAALFIHSDPTKNVYMSGADWITLSGGNPCMHDLSHLVSRLRGWGYHIAVETQGTFCPKWLWDCDIITCSPKGPGMGEKFEEDKFKAFLTRMAGKRGFNCKVVIFDQKDLEFAERVATRWVNSGFSLNDFYLSQGNPFPPNHLPSAPENLVDVLRQEYLTMFELIKVMPHLAHTKWLPQWHVWLWANRQGV